MKRNTTVLLGLLASYGLVPLLFGSNHYIMSMVVAALVIGGVALSWALLGNLGGMVSFGHSAFFGVGAYTSAIVSMKLGLPVPLSMLLGGLGAVIASAAMLPVLRLRGPYFALAILAYAHIFRILATEWKPVTGGAAGISNIPPLPEVLGVDLGSKTGNYWVILSLVVALALVYHLIRKSHYGLALRAMHESEDATRVVGVNSTLLKGLMLVVSAFMCGLVGASMRTTSTFWNPTTPSAASGSRCPCGGHFRRLPHHTGPVIGAVAVYLVDQLVFKAIMPSGHQLVLGLLLVAMVLLSPDGLLFLARKLRREAPCCSLTRYRYALAG